jgi:hypothetical protein
MGGPAGPHLRAVPPPVHLSVLTGLTDGVHSTIRRWVELTGDPARVEVWTHGLTAVQQAHLADTGVIVRRVEADLAEGPRRDAVRAAVDAGDPAVLNAVVKYAVLEGRGGTWADADVVPGAVHLRSAPPTMPTGPRDGVPLLPLLVGSSLPDSGVLATGSDPTGLLVAPPGTQFVSELLDSAADSPARLADPRHVVEELRNFLHPGSRTPLEAELRSGHFAVDATTLAPWRGVDEAPTADRAAHVMLAGTSKDTREAVEQRLRAALPPTKKEIRGLDLLLTVLEEDPETLRGGATPFELTVDRRPYSVTLEVRPDTGRAHPVDAAPKKQVERFQRNTLLAATARSHESGIRAGADANAGGQGGGGGLRGTYSAVDRTTMESRAVVLEETSLTTEKGTPQELPARIEMVLSPPSGAAPTRLAVDGRVEGWSVDVTAHADPGPTRELGPGNAAGLVNAVPLTVTTPDLEGHVEGVKGQLHPSITAVGAPGRTDLGNFLSAAEQRRGFARLVAGWVTSPPLVSADGRMTGAVQARLVPVLSTPFGTTTVKTLSSHRLESGDVRTTRSRLGGDLELYGGYRFPAAPVGGQLGPYVHAAFRSERTTNVVHQTLIRRMLNHGGPLPVHDLEFRLETRVLHGATSRDVAPLETGTAVRTTILPEHAARAGLTDPVSGPPPRPRELPPYLSQGRGFGDAHVHSLGTAPQELLAQARRSVGNIRKYEALIPDPADGPQQAQRGRTPRVATDNSRTMETFLSESFLGSHMDSLIGSEGIDQTFIREGGRRDTFVNVNLTATMTSAADAGPLPDATLKNSYGTRTTVADGAAAPARRSWGSSAGPASPGTGRVRAR